jgi:toxin ParE1/3/4
MSEHRIAPEAELELDRIWSYIAIKSNSFETADRVIDNITDRFSLLANNPYIGRRRDLDLRPGLRTFPVGDYIIIYRIEDEFIVILHVIHGSRNIKALLGD